MIKPSLTIGYLYGDCMNIYGDTGNIICLRKRAEWRGIKVKVKNISLNDKLPDYTSDVQSGIDIYFFGGGQDQAQEEVSKDLEKTGKGKLIRAEVERGVPLLAICGGYQLLGDYYQPFDQPKLTGVGLFPIFTMASHDRMIGNIVISPTSSLQHLTSKLVGFENHSGKTYLRAGAQPLGKVIKGFGNNGEDGTEGCVYKHAIGCYMHGSLLPKNPQLADWLLQKALEIKCRDELMRCSAKGGVSTRQNKIKLKPLSDKLELQAHQAAVQKFS